MKLKMVLGFILLWGFSLGHADPKGQDEPTGDNVFIITMDGYRWQELFGGADSLLINNTRWTGDTATIKSKYWAATPGARREKLMPFFWNVIAQQGQVYGNRDKGSRVNTKNIYFLSYPGYNEIFTGEADPLVATNKKIKNRNTNLLEYLHKTPAYAGRVAAFTSWDAFPYILNRERSGFFMNSGREAIKDAHLTPLQKSLNKMQSNPETAPTEHTRSDMITFLAAKEYIKKHKPKVMLLGLSGTDDAGHDKRYDKYLESAHEADRILADLWNTVQAMPQYKGRTTFIITTDHGRGSNHETWYNHGFFVKGSSQTWMAMVGNGVRTLGEVADGPQLYQKHISGTVGYLLGVHSFSKSKIPQTAFNRGVGSSEAVAVK